ncbi:MAG: Eco57I restriction-modification methylase domain-containing protein [Candidatus Hermodarchaeota archaeon]
MASSDSIQNQILKLRELRQRLFQCLLPEFSQFPSHVKHQYSLHVLLSLLICRLATLNIFDEKNETNIGVEKIELSNFLEQVAITYPPLTVFIDVFPLEAPVYLTIEELRNFYRQISTLEPINDVRILGYFYEDYLQTSASEKKKNQGVFYTPWYIIQFFLKEMVLPALDRQLKSFSSFDMEKITPITLLDPACGSGGFLLQAFDFLFEFYQKSARSLNNATIKRFILEKCLFGVESDSYAAAIAKISLLLHAGIHNPSIINIKTGNALIKTKNHSYIDFKPFSWASEFSGVFTNGGFDFILGNPPYVNVEKIPQNLRNYLMETYETVMKRFDLYIPFLELGYKILKPGGKLGYILPYPFLYERYASKLRELILHQSVQTTILDLSTIQIFKSARVRNTCLILEKPKTQADDLEPKFIILKPINQPNNQQIIEYSRKEIPAKFYSDLPVNMFRLDIEQIDLILLKKIKHKSIELGDICYVNWGARTGNVRKYVVNTPGPNRKLMINGRDIKPYFIDKPSKYLIYTKEELYNPMFEELFENQKLIIPDITGRRGIIAAFDDNHLYAEHTVSLAVKWCELEGVNRRGLKISPLQKQISQQYDLKYLLAQINSSVAQYFFRTFLSGGLHTYPNDVKKLPIFRIDFSNQFETEEFLKIICLASKLIELKKATKNRSSNQTLILEKKIDNLVINLYKLDKIEVDRIKSLMSN